MMGNVMRNPVRPRQAASLVEVMVVLVVLVVGVFAVIQVFPAGFTFLRTGGNRTVATRFAQAMMEQVRSDSANLPESISYSFLGSTGLVTVVDEDPDNLDRRADGNPYFSDVNKARYVRGEAVRIGMPSPGNFGSGFPYMVKFGPIYLDPVYGDPATAPAGASALLSVVGAPLLTIDSNVDSADGTRDPNDLRGALRSPRHYVMDPGTNGGGAYLLVLPTGRDRVFKVRYLVVGADGAGGAATEARSEEEEVQVAADAFAWVRLTKVASGESVATGSEVVTRAFRRLAAADNWSASDPYEYKLASANIAGAPGQTSYANLGQLAFNPSGSGYIEESTTGNAAFTAYIDYTVLDWHILRDDREVPSAFADSAGAVAIRLTLVKLKRNGDANADNTLYDGLFPSSDTDPASNYDLRVVRLDTGAVLVQGNYDERAGTDQGADYWTRDGREGTWDSGTVYINTNRVPPGTPVRVLYKADGDWAVALQKAATNYRAWQASQSGRPPADSSDGDLSFGDPARFGIEGTKLYFPLCELNKSVVVRIEAVDGSGERVRKAPVQVTIDTADDEHAFVDMARYLPSGTSRWRVVGGVATGVSLKVRVIWKDRAVDNAPWQIQDLDSYVTAGGKS
ncbi:MAG: hypothetical protein ACKO5K_09735 [Armatimonadota bacterium]